MENSVFPDRDGPPWSPGTTFLDLSAGDTPRSPRRDSRDTSPTMPSGPAPVVTVAALFAPLDEVFPRDTDQGGGGLGGPEPPARGAPDGGVGALGLSPVLPSGTASTGGAPAVQSAEDTLPPPSPRRAADAQPRATSSSSPTASQPRSLASTASVVTGQLVVGADAGAAPRVKVIDAATGSVRLNFLAFANSFQGGVRVASADVNADGTPDVIAGQGAGGANRVRVFNGVNGNAFSGTLGNFQAFASNQSDGVFVASGDVNADGKADILVGTDVGYTARVKVFSGANGALLGQLTPDGLGTGGVRVAAGDVNADGKADLIAAAGPGSASPRVCVFDAVTRQEVYDFFAFDPSYKGGVHIAAGDLDGDGKADLVAGMSSGGALVRTFRGADLASLGSAHAYGEAVAGGVRVGLVDADGDARFEVATAQGPGGGQLRLLDGLTLEPKGNASSFPFGNSFTNGFFVGGDARADGGISTLSSGAVLSIQASTPYTEEGSTAPLVFTITRSGDTSGSTFFTLLLGGTATSGPSGDRPGVLTPAFTFEPDETIKTYEVLSNEDGEFEGPETVTATLGPDRGADYTIDGPGVAVGVIDDDDGSDPHRLDGDGCEDLGLLQTECGLHQGADAASCPTGVDVVDGYLIFLSADIEPAGPVDTLMGTRSWSSQPGLSAVTWAPDGTFFTKAPWMTKDSDGTITVVTGCANAPAFDDTGSGFEAFDPRDGTLVYDSGNAEYVLTDTTGGVLEFHDFDTGLPAARRGALKSYTDPDGNVTSVSYNTDGTPSEMQHSDTTGGVTVTESLAHAYVGGSGPNAGKVSSLTLRRQTDGGSWSTVRQVEYAYYDGSEAGGTAGDLKTATVKDAAGAVLDREYYRYYTAGQADGYAGGLKYAFRAASFGRLAAAFTDPFAATDAQVDDYADLAVKYDSTRRVTEAVAQGEGCSSCSGGLGSFTYSRTVSPFADGFNNWRTKSVETLPDGNQEITYVNYAGQVILSVFKEVSSGTQWRTFYKYDDSGRLWPSHNSCRFLATNR